MLEKVLDRAKNNLLGVKFEELIGQLKDQKFNNTSEIKLAAANAGISRVEVREHKLMLTRRGDFILVAGKFPRLVAPKIEQHLGEILELIKKL